MVREFQLGMWTVQPARNALVQEGKEQRLSHKAMAVLVCLAEVPGNVVTKEALFERVWDGRFASDEVLTTVVYELRRALGDSARQPRYVETIRKSGYRLVAPVELPEALEENLQDFEALPTLATSAPWEDHGGQPRRLWWRWALAAAVFAGLVVALLPPRAPTPPAETEEDVRSVAVLPLTDLDGEPDRFAEALTERLVADLVGPEGLEVLPSLATRGAGRFTLEQVGSEIGADTVVEGAVVRSEDRLWVSVQLVDVRSGRLLWGGAFERKVLDALDLQRELSREIVTQIHRQLLDPGGGSLSQATASEAADAFELGTYFLRQGTSLGAEKAEGYFRLALELDPKFTSARVGLAGSLLASAEELSPADQPEAWNRVRQELATALELDTVLPSPPICEAPKEGQGTLSEELLLCVDPRELEAPDLDFP
jgi:DNA-binding winged helix-turn-helix (wHTH) protein/TolB-like protein